MEWLRDWLRFLPGIRSQSDLDPDLRFPERLQVSAWSPPLQRVEALLTYLLQAPNLGPTHPYSHAPSIVRRTISNIAPLEEAQPEPSCQSPHSAYPDSRQKSCHGVPFLLPARFQPWHILRSELHRFTMVAANTEGL